MDLFLVMNPGSRSGRGIEAWPELLDGLRRAGVPFDVGFTRDEADAAALAERADREGFAAVAAVGGDGTINGVLNGLVRPGMARARAAFATLYTGTSPDFCRRLALPTDPAGALSALLSGARRRIDLCRIVHRAPDGAGRCERVFASSANFGVGAAIARGANTGLRRALGDAAGTLASTVAAILRHEPRPLAVDLDGERRVFPDLFNLFVGKNPLIASGIRLEIDLSPDDGRMFALPLHGVTKGSLLATLADAYTGRLARRHPVLFPREIVVHPQGGADEVEYDGDPRGLLPARITLLPGAVEVLGAGTPSPGAKEIRHA